MVTKHCDGTRFIQMVNCFNPVNIRHNLAHILFFALLYWPIFVIIYDLILV